MTAATRTAIKNTPTAYEIVDYIENRWSPRTFSDLPISKNEMLTIFEAGRWAPSSNNMQPWVIFWGLKGTQAYDRIFDCLDPFNQSWAGNATALILSGYKKTTPDGKENFHALHDLGQFMANAAIQGQYNNIAMHQMAGVQHEVARKAFKLPDNFHIATATAVGYYGGDLDKLPEDLKEAETAARKRKSQQSFVFNGDFVPSQFDE